MSESRRPSGKKKCRRQNTLLKEENAAFARTAPWRNEGGHRAASTGGSKLHPGGNPNIRREVRLPRGGRRKPCPRGSDTTGTVTSTLRAAIGKEDFVPRKGGEHRNLRDRQDVPVIKGVISKGRGRGGLIRAQSAQNTSLGGFRPWIPATLGDIEF